MTVADVLALAGGVLFAIAAVAVFSPITRVRLRRSIAPVAVAVLALVVVAAYVQTL